MRLVKNGIYAKSAAGIVNCLILVFIASVVFTGFTGAQEKPAFAGAEKWKLTTLGGKTVEFGEFKGKVIFINIWATWCMPCIIEMKSIQELYDSYKDEDVVFLIVSNESKSTVQKFYDKSDLTLPVYLTGITLPENFRTMGIPATFIVSREGKIVLEHMGAVDWNNESCRKFIRDLLDNKTDIEKPQLNSSGSSGSSQIPEEQMLRAITSSVTSTVTPFIERHNLTDEVKTQIIDTLIDEQKQLRGLRDRNLSIPEQTRQYSEIGAKCDEKISGILTEDEYAAYVLYKKMTSEWVTVSQIQKELDFHNIKLDKDSEEKLVAAMYDDKEEISRRQREDQTVTSMFGSVSQEDMIKRTIKIQEIASGMYIESAGDILTEEQMKIFKRYFEYQIYSLERMLINRLK